MRIAVLTGVFACAVTFAAGSGNANAATLQNNEAISSRDTISRMVAVAETTDASLIKESEEEKAKENKTIKDEFKEKEPAKHKVAQGESLVKIAPKYEIEWTRIFDKNIQLENPDLIMVGEELIIPETDEVLEKREIATVAVEQEVVSSTTNNSNARPVATDSSTNSTNAAPRAQAVQTSTPAPRGNSGGNRYVAGYCTWYVKNRRPDLPNNLGNANTWVSRASAQGIATGSTPRAGAVGQQGNHVVYVESVNGDGTVTVSEMNWKGLYVQSSRTVSSSSFRYIY
jgi:surface antigen